MREPSGERDERFMHERDAFPHREERDDFVVAKEQDVHVGCDTMKRTPPAHRRATMDSAYA
jgi:hypothetical protein